MTEAVLAQIRESNQQTRRMVQQSLDHPLRAVLVPVVLGTVWAAVVIAGTVVVMKGF